MTRGRILALIPLLAAIHNAEEAAAFSRSYATLRVHLAAALGIEPAADVQTIYLALAIVTVLPFAVVLWQASQPRSGARLWIVLLVQAVMSLNVVSHVASAAFIFHGYSPGLLTAITLNLPFSVYLFARVWREHWLARRAMLWLIPAAAAIHGPVLLALLWLTGTIGNR